MPYESSDTWLLKRINAVPDPSCFPKTDELPPDGESGDFAVVRFTLTEDDVFANNLRALRDSPVGIVRPGHYVKLIGKGHLWMSNTQMELRTNRSIVRQARGDVLLAGLGLGLILRPILNNAKVTSVTVLEKHRDVIKLVAPHFKHPKLTVVRADAEKYKPKAKAFDTVWFDIWPDDDVEEAAERMRKRYAAGLRPGGWMEFWMNKDQRAPLGGRV